MKFAAFRRRPHNLGSKSLSLPLHPDEVSKEPQRPPRSGLLETAGSYRFVAT
jgi:hypothetical protein